MQKNTKTEADPYGMTTKEQTAARQTIATADFCGMTISDQRLKG
jgi:hypothetical protein